MIQLPPSPAHDPLGAASGWVAALLTGSMASSLAIVTVALIGFGMLQGRLPLRNGVRVVLGCFVMFGANTIASGILSLTQDHIQMRATEPQVVIPPPEPLAKTPEFDPYAGASVPK